MKKIEAVFIQSFFGPNNQRKADVTYRKTNLTPHRCFELESLRAIARGGVKFYLEEVWFVKNYFFLEFSSAIQNHTDFILFIYRISGLLIIF